MIDPDAFDWPNKKQRLFKSKPPNRKKAEADPTCPESGPASFFDWDRDFMWDLT